MFLNQLNQSLSVTYLFLASAFRTVRKRKGELIWLENNTFLPGYAWAVSAPPATLAGLGRTSRYEGLSPACPRTGDAPSALRVFNITYANTLHKMLSLKLGTGVRWWVIMRFRPTPFLSGLCYTLNIAPTEEKALLSGASWAAGIEKAEEHPEK